MSIPISCPRCGARATAPDRAAGRTLPCPGCGQPLTVAPVAALAAPAFEDLDSRPSRRRFTLPLWFHVVCRTASTLLALLALAVQAYLLWQMFGNFVETASGQPMDPTLRRNYLVALGTQIGGMLGTLAAWTLVLTIVDLGRRVRGIEASQ